MALKWSPNKRRDNKNTNDNRSSNNQKVIKQNTAEKNRTDKKTQGTNLLSRSFVPDTTMVHTRPPAAPATLSVVYTETLPVYTNMTYYPTYNTYPYNYYPFNNWNAIITSIPTVTTIYTLPVTTPPVFCELPQMYSPRVYPYGSVVTQFEQPVPEYNPLVPPPCFAYEQPIVEEIGNTSQDETSAHDVTNTTSSSSSIANTSFNSSNTSFDTLNTSFNTPDTSFKANPSANVAKVTPRPSFVGPVTRREPAQPLEYYLQLPRNLFTPQRYLKIDPNPVIDAFCKLTDAQNQLAWITDLEFGVPRVPVRRQIAQYDVKISNVICRNTAGITYPAYENCSQEFKHIISLYYDFVISAWYKGYLSIKRNRSRSGFEAWISRPMETLGMCWP